MAIIPTPRTTLPGLAGIIGLGCADPLAMNANSDASIPCVYGSAAPPTPQPQVAGNQPSKAGGYEPVDTVTDWLYQNVVTPAAQSPTGTYVDPSLMQTQLLQSAQEYCAGVASGGPNNPCAGEDLSSIAQQLTQTYSAQVAAKGGTPTVNLNNAQPYQFTAYAPSYNSAGPGYILMPDGSKVPNSSTNLQAAQQMYNVSLGLPAGYGSSSTLSAPASTSTPASAPVTYAAPVLNSSPTEGFIPSVAPTVSPAQMTTINGTSPVASTTPATTNWLTDPTQELISGVQNWMLLAAAAAALLLVKK